MEIIAQGNLVKKIFVSISLQLNHTVIHFSTSIGKRAVAAPYILWQVLKTDNCITCLLQFY